MQIPKEIKKPFWIVVLLSALMSLSVQFLIPLRGHYTGDHASNVSVYHGGSGFIRFGFFASKLIPVQQELDPGIKTAAEIPKDKLYTHYPPATDIIQGILLKLGLKSWFSHHLFALLVMFTGAYFCWKTLTGLIGIWPAWLAFSAVILNPSYVFFADSFHCYPWFFLFSWFYLWFLLRWCNAFSLKPKKTSYRLNSWDAFKLFGLGYFVSWFSFDPIPSFLAVGLAIPFMRKGSQPLSWGSAFLLACTPALGGIVGFLAHVVQNGLALGSMQAAIKDLVDTFLLRAGAESSQITEEFFHYDPIKHAVKYFLAAQWFYTIPLLVLAIFGWRKAVRADGFSKRESGVYFGLFWATLIGALFWQGFMRQHSMIHAFTVRHADMFFALGFAAFSHWLFWKYGKKVFMRWAVVILLALLVHTGLGLAQWEGTAIKRPLVRWLIQTERQDYWACLQKNRLAYTSELSGAKQIVSEIIPNGCGGVAGSSKWFHSLRFHLAELVLYWR